MRDQKSRIRRTEYTVKEYIVTDCVQNSLGIDGSFAHRSSIEHCGAKASLQIRPGGEIFKISTSPAKADHSPEQF